MRAAAAALDRFSSLWAQAIQAYEATLVPDRTPLDRFLAGDPAALTAVQQQGLDVFRGKADCARCHAGPELTDASVGFAARHGAKRIRPIGLSAADKAALVDFLQNGLTDCRVAAEAAPFDHPSLDLANGPSLEEVGAAGNAACP